MDIKTFKEFDSFLPNEQPRLLMGPAGIGKSAVVRDLAEKRNHRFIDLRLTELEPSDLVGLPFLEDDGEGGKITSYAAPHWWPKDGNVTILLDEMDRAREDMQPVAMQFTLDRRAGGRDLPEGVVIYAACNGEKYMTSSIDQALMNRFACVELAPEVSEWVSWANANNVHQSVVNFIMGSSDMLDTPEKMIGVPNQPTPTRRSWSALGFAMNNLDEKLRADGKGISDVEYLHLFAAPFVGQTAALAWATWTKDNFSTITVQDVFSGKVKPENLNILQVSLVAEEAADVFIDEDNTTDEQRYNCLKFFMAAGHEAFAALFSALDPIAAPMIQKFDDVDKFIKESNDVLKDHLDKVEQQKASSLED